MLVHNCVLFLQASIRTRLGRAVNESTGDRNSLAAPTTRSTRGKKTQTIHTNYRSNKSKNIRNDSINAPMPGLILKLCKKEGEVVKKGESLLILEAMKMENEIRSTVDGIIKEVFKKEGSSVEKGEIILTIE